MAYSFMPDLGAPINTILALGLVYYAQQWAFPSFSITAPFTKAVSSIRSRGVKQKEPETKDEFDGSYMWTPQKFPEVLVWEQFTPMSLQKFNGKDEKRILLAINRKVFDVTAGASFYGPDGPYGNFAGRDASRGMAKQSFDEDMLTPVEKYLDKLDDLTPSEIENMNGWIEHFSSKYIVCGELIENSADGRY